MKKIIKEIKRLSTNIKGKDYMYASRFIDKHDYNSLKELVDSILYKIQNNFEFKKNLLGYTEKELFEISYLANLLELNRNKLGIDE